MLANGEQVLTVFSETRLVELAAWLSEIWVQTICLQVLTHERRTAIRRLKGEIDHWMALQFVQGTRAALAHYPVNRSCDSSFSKMMAELLSPIEWVNSQEMLSGPWVRV
jgi:hypothetical protein